MRLEGENPPPQELVADPAPRSATAALPRVTAMHRLVTASPRHSPEPIVPKPTGRPSFQLCSFPMLPAVVLMDLS
jgi:hypothetical protein